MSEPQNLACTVCSRLRSHCPVTLWSHCVGEDSPLQTIWKAQAYPAVPSVNLRATPPWAFTFRAQR